MKKIIAFLVLLFGLITIHSQANLVLKKCLTYVVLFSVCFCAHSQKTSQFFPEKELITTGIYYYPEHWKESQWERDIATIAGMGYEFVHLDEFAWFKMESEEGKFNFTCLDKVVNLCTKYHLKVLLCTPSATTPTWMRVNYPETFIMDGHYIHAENGTRGKGSIMNQRYRNYVRRIVTEMAKRYGKNPNVIGWQIDNEPGALADYSPSSQEAFRSWLRDGFFIAVNYSSDNYTMNISTTSKILIGEKILKPAGVLVWSE